MKLFGALPFTCRMASPAFTPALPAGLCACTTVMTSGVVPTFTRAPNQYDFTNSVGKMSDSASSTRRMGMAKPMPCARCPSTSFRTATLMPISSPRKLTSGPPLLPRLMGASVCSQFGMSSDSPSLGSTRLFELKMPRVTEPPSPKGLPRASTVSPRSRSSSRANWIAWNFSPGGAFSLSKATSLLGSLATTVAE